MQLEIPLVSHIYQDQATKSSNILPGFVRNCLDFNHFSKMTFKNLMKKVKDNLSAQRFYYALSNKYIDYYLLPLVVYFRRYILADEEPLCGNAE